MLGLARLRVCSGVHSKGGNKADKKGFPLAAEATKQESEMDVDFLLLESVIERGHRKNQCAIFLAASRGIAGPATVQLAAANEDDNGKTTSFF